MIDSINKIKGASNCWGKQHKVDYLEYLSKEYDELEKRKYKPIGTGYATQTVIMANINGNIDYFSIDLDGLSELYHFIKDNLDSQSDNGANMRMR